MKEIKTIIQAKAAKNNIELEILNLVGAFEIQTGLEIENIILYRIAPDSTPKSKPTNVELKIEFK